MTIQKVKVKNYTVFKDCHLNVSPSVNIFIGENGTGKTHLLKAIYAACEVTKDLHFGATKFVEYFTQNAEQIGLIFNKNSAEDEDINISFSVTDADQVTTSSSLVSPVSTNSYIFSVPANVKMNAVYIPCKDMLTHSNGFLAMANTYQNFPFDKTLTDIVAKNSRWKMKTPPVIASSILPVLEEMIDGEVIFENDDFFIKKRDGRKIIFNIEAEGLKKIGLLWQLLMTNSIAENSILLWDEPEANLNPKFLPKLVECLLQLSRNGVQIFLSTHNYIFAKYFDVLKKDSDKILYHSLYFDDKVEGVQVETQPFFQLLQHNDIADAFNLLLERVYDMQVRGK